MVTTLPQFAVVNLYLDQRGHILVWSQVASERWLVQGVFTKYKIFPEN